MNLSIIVVNYNTYDYTKQCIESVLEALDHTVIGLQGEIIIVDNNSPDGSGEQLRDLFKEDERVQVILNTKNDGYSKANNIGLKEASGDYLLLLNSDTVIQEDTLDSSVRFLEAHPEYSVLGCKVQLPNGKLDTACKRSFPTPASGAFHTLKLDKLFPKSQLFGAYNLTYLDEDMTSEVDCIMGAFMCVRRSAYEDIGGLDEDYFMYGEDIDWCYRFKEAGYRIVYHPESSITHFKKASWSGKTNPKVLNAFYDSMVIFYNKHYQNKYGPITTAAVKGGTGLLKKIANFINKNKKSK